MAMGPTGVPPKDFAIHGGEPQNEVWRQSRRRRLQGFGMAAVACKQRRRSGADEKVESAHVRNRTTKRSAHISIRGTVKAGNRIVIIALTLAVAAARADEGVRIEKPRIRRDALNDP